jgi:hypothetical protein
MHSRGITEHTTTPMRLILPTAGQANFFINMLDETSFPVRRMPEFVNKISIWAVVRWRRNQQE